VRLGRLECYEALHGVIRNGGRIDYKLRIGSMILKALGPQFTVRLFQFASRAMVRLSPKSAARRAAKK
jgi:hypothetical protein